jgi:hypothetical protein
VKSSARIMDTIGPYDIFIGNVTSPRRCAIVEIAPTIVAPSAVQRAFDITNGVKISTSSVLMKPSHMRVG